jgi:hypothetical protein
LDLNFINDGDDEKEKYLELPQKYVNSMKVLLEKIENVRILLYSFAPFCLS